MTPRHDDSTRDRILSAAKDEFSRHGIAGARVDRVAKAARTSKERVYAYFSGKEALYRFVAANELAAAAEATRLTPGDLPGYAGRLHDHFAAHPEHFRLMLWGQLELSDADDPVRQSVAPKLEQLRQAQAEGILDPGWDPLDVLATVHQIATAWADQPHYLTATGGPERQEFLAGRRAVVVSTVEKLFPAKPSA